MKEMRKTDMRDQKKKTKKLGNWEPNTKKEEREGKYKIAGWKRKHEGEKVPPHRHRNEKEKEEEKQLAKQKLCMPSFQPVPQQDLTCLEKADKFLKQKEEDFITKKKQGNQKQ
eukprot:TRINITY_DN2823_c0_g3_i2.p2 TRINITY_DN2823_c0_g3~~TRINITY_DN2823_c0_g3_i2.p2  ORF type:complete len:113 (-),score=31.04 TRINITY_DN2823_c0_g3_i2:1593-1931(-)